MPPPETSSDFSPTASRACDGRLYRNDGGIEFGLTVRVALEVLHGALIGLDAAEFQCRRGIDRLRNLNCGAGSLDAAAARAAVDFDEALQGRVVPLRGSRKLCHVRQIIDADDDPRAVLRQPREAIDLDRIAHFVRHEDVLDAAAGEDLRLGNLLAADADRAAQALLQLLHVDRLVHLAVAAVAHAVRLGVVTHLPDVALERIEIEDQAGRLDIGLLHAGQCGDVIADHIVGQLRRPCMASNVTPGGLVIESQTFPRW